MTACACGKQSWPSKDAADRVVVDAKIKAGLRGNTKRREQRSYACPVRADLWHVTSQPDTGPGPAPLPTFPATDDEAAAEFISDALRHQYDTTWTALLTENRVAQTARVLDRLRLNLAAQETERHARVQVAQSRWRIGNGTADELEQARIEWDEWRAKVAHFKAAVKSRLNDSRQALETVRANQRNARENDAHRDALRLLTLAVTRHLHATPEPTEPDRRLWAWLTVLAIPHNDHTVSLADMVAGKHWTDTPDELRKTA